MNNPFRRLLLGVIGLSAGIAVSACQKTEAEGKGKGGPPRNIKVPVLAAEVQTKDMPVVVRAIGQVNPKATVAVKAQVTGQIAEVHFEEGQSVEKGDLLFTIDKRPFQAALDQARAALAQAGAEEKNAAQQARRYTELGRTGTVAREQVDQLRTGATSAQAAVAAAEAAVRNAELQLEYTAVRAPISGRAGRYLAHPGNVVRANETDLVVLNQIQPIEVSFAVAERYLREVREASSSGRAAVRATPDGLVNRTAAGSLSFVDNAVKATSGTIELKGVFENSDLELWPGQFVNVELQLRVESGALVAPSRAVQSGQKGNHVFVIKPDQTVEVRQVELVRTLGDDAVIAKGVQPGERVVIDGQSRLTPGARVEVRTSLAAPIPAEPGKGMGKLTTS